MNKTLAKARPNLKYRWYRCFEFVTLEARSTETGKISFYEINKGIGIEKRISEEIVLSMFRSDCCIADRPFLVKENEDFYAILKRNLKQFQDQVQALIQ
jgi:hypothetical protein